MDTKRSARCLLAKLVRSRSGTNTSVLRVRTTLRPRPSSIMRAARRVTSRTTTFSSTPPVQLSALMVGAMTSVQHIWLKGRGAPATRARTRRLGHIPLGAVHVYHVAEWLLERGRLHLARLSFQNDLEHAIRACRLEPRLLD